MTSDVDLEVAQARVLPSPVRRRAARRRGWGGLVLALVLVTVAAWTVVLSQDGSPIPGAAEVVERTAGFVSDLLGVGREATPAYLDPASLSRVAGLALETVVMSVLAAGLAALGALATIAFAARSLTIGELGSGRLPSRLAFLVARGLHVVTRSVPEVVWALLLVFTIRPGVVAGALALALHDLGVMGRLGSDVIDDLDRAPLRSLRAAGARRLALLAYGVLPQALPQLVTYLLYRWEVIVRASVVVGFITAGGLGYQLRLDLSFRRWTDVALVLLAYVLLVWTVDAVSSALRRLAR
jgi:phosphonate transport system permease protein